MDMDLCCLVVLPKLRELTVLHHQWLAMLEVIGNVNGNGSVLLVVLPQLRELTVLHQQWLAMLEVTAVECQ